MEQDFKSDRLVGRATRSTYESALSVLLSRRHGPIRREIVLFKRLLALVADVYSGPVIAMLSFAG